MIRGVESSGADITGDSIIVKLLQGVKSCSETKSVSSRHWQVFVLITSHVCKNCLIIKQFSQFS